MKKRILLLPLLMACALSPVHAQSLTAEQTTIYCGQVPFSQPVTAEFKLCNHATAPITITDVRTSCGCVVVDYPRKEIAPGEQFSITATYDARLMGTFQKQIGVYSKQDKKPLMLNLQGKVVREVVDFDGEYPEQLGNFMADKSEVEFDNVNRGDRPTQIIHIRNNSETSFRPVVMHLPSYLSAVVSPTLLAPQRGGNIYLTLDSEKLRDMGLNQVSVYLGEFPGDTVSSEKEITVSTILLSDFSQLTAKQLENAPKLQLSATTLDLGPFGNKKKLKGQVTLTNEGKRTLEINSIQMMSTGLQVSLNKTKIEPGETAKLKVTVVRNELRKRRRKPRILMITNDPDMSKVIIDIKTK